MHDGIKVAMPRSGLATEETGLRPESRRVVTPEMRREVLSRLRELVQYHNGLSDVVQSLINGDPGHATGLLRMVQYGGQPAPSDHLGTVARLVQASMCPHHEGIFVSLHRMIPEAGADSTGHDPKGVPARG